MPCLSRDILFDVGEKIIENGDSGIVTRFTLSGKQSLQAMKNVSATVKHIELHKDHFIIGWDQKCYKLHKSNLKFFTSCIGNSVIDLHINFTFYEPTSEYQRIIDKVIDRKPLFLRVIACYDSTNSNPLRQGDCDPGQCEFRAGVKVAQTNFLWFSSIASNTPINDPNGICKTATMEYPEATPDGILPFLSCDPLKHDGNVVKLYVYQVPPGCSFYVENAKKWTPPTTTTTSQNSSDLSETNQTTSKSSEANTTLWIGISVGIFILLIVVIGFGYCCYRTQIQKKPLFGKKKEVQQKAFIPEAPKKASAVKEKTADEKEVLTPEKIVAKPEPPKEANVAKEKPPKPTKKKISEKKAPVVPKPSKEITQKNATKEDAVASL